MIYLDSSALLKLVHAEVETPRLRSYLAERPAVPLVSSELALVEVVRAARRLDGSLVPVARSLLRQLDLVPLARDLLESAADVGGATLRSLDALHLACALSVRDALSDFVAYDVRLLEAAAAAGLPTLRPGA